MNVYLFIFLVISKVNLGPTQPFERKIAPSVLSAPIDVIGGHGSLTELTLSSLDPKVHLLKLG